MRVPVREISHVTLAVEHPGPEDGIIARLAEPERLAWMHANYKHTGRDQVADMYAGRGPRSWRTEAGPAQSKRRALG